MAKTMMAKTMQFEVENKYVVEDVEQLVRQLESIGATLDPAVQQTDLYFAHPVRDFAVTDEAFRIRSIGPNNFVTYKGPKLDTATKTRQELEIPLASGEEHRVAYCQLLELLDFRAVAQVRKQRRTGHCVWKKLRVEFALDVVEHLGNFVELEILSDRAALANAQKQLVELAETLGFSKPLRKSYLEMLLDKQQ